MVDYGDLTIDEEFLHLLPAIPLQELKQLRTNVLRDGCIRDPIDIWKNIVIDGHNRLAIGREEGLRIPRLRDHPELKTRDEVKVWILRKQLGRRNLSKEFYRLLAGQLYLAAKKARGAPLGNHNRQGNQNREGNQNRMKNSGEHGELKLAQPEPINSTAALIALETGLSESTVKRGAKDVAAINNLTPDLKTAYRSRKLTDRQAIRLGRLDHVEQEKFAELVKNGQSERSGQNALDNLLGVRKLLGVKNRLGEKDLVRGKNPTPKAAQMPSGNEAVKLCAHFSHVGNWLRRFDEVLYEKHKRAINEILDDLRERCRT